MGGGMMGGGMMGGMGGGMGGGMMGGGMRSVAPTGLAFADLKPGQTRKLPTRMVSLDPPDPQGAVRLAREGEGYRVTDIAELSDSPRVQKAMRRLSAAKASTQLAQLVMWNVAAGLDWTTIAGLSADWTNRHGLALAKDFVDRLDRDDLDDFETGRILFRIEGKDKAGKATAEALRKELTGKVVLGLRAAEGVPSRPSSPALACQVQVKGGEVQVQLASSDAAVRAWVPMGKFSLPIAEGAGAANLADAVAEGLVGRVVRAQVVKGPRDAKGKLTYRIRIDNASPLQLNALSATGLETKGDEKPRVLQGISIPPHRSMTVPASEEVVNSLALKRGIRVTALDLSGL
jgi:hypothetical protein